MTRRLLEELRKATQIVADAAAAQARAEGAWNRTPLGRAGVSEQQAAAYRQAHPPTTSTRSTSGKVLEYAAPVLTTYLHVLPVVGAVGIMNLNKGATAQGVVWGAAGGGGGAISGSSGKATAGLAAVGWFAGYYSALISRDYPTD